MSEPQDFSGLSGAAVVTGGSGGVGAAVCRLLAARGTDVALSYNSSAAKAQATVAAITETGRRAMAWQADLADHTAARAFVEGALAEFGGVHTLVHAAGLYVNQLHLSRVTPEQFERHLIGEASGFFNVAQPLLPALREQRGSVVAVTTMATRRFPIKDGLSSGPKGAVEATVRALALEEARFGVRCNCVGPGILSDGMAGKFLENGEMDERSLEVARSRVPLGRFGTAEDIAEAVCFLASARASYITGQMLDVEGGYTL